MSESSGGAHGRDYSVFDAELTHQAFNFRLFIRLLGWLKPYRKTVLLSVVLVIISATTAVLMPVVLGRVVIDSVLVPNPLVQNLPDYGMIFTTQWITELLAIEPLLAAVLIFIVLVLAQGVFMYVHRVTLASAALQALRDLRLDLFESLERKPSSFFDHVAVGRVMTRVVNDIENLFELLTGFGMLVGEFVPFFLAMFLMFHISGELTGVLMLFTIPIAVIGTYIFRLMMRQIFRLIRNSVSALNQYMHEDFVGIEVVR
jgi:ATP-binding cassette subfamily B multidrug efflux pump